MRKQHKKYQKPKKLFNKIQIEEEDSLLKNYGLKNKKELWKAEAKIEKIRKQAKKLLTAPQEQQQFLNKLATIGLIKANANIDDLLELKKEDILNRRLQTIVHKKGLATTAKQARQLIVHKKIMVSEKILNIPSYIVPIAMEKEITRKNVK